LRDLGKTVYNAAQKMAIHIDIKEDALYQIGQEEGKLEGKQEGRLEEKDETALNMLREGFPEEVVERITKLPAKRVTQLRQQLDAGQ
jgi:predicted transposase/invertase (TIGR01784 family)